MPAAAAAAVNTDVIIHMPSRNAARSDWRCPSSTFSLNPPVDILWLGVDRRGKCL